MIFNQKINKILRKIETVDEVAGKFALSIVIGYRGRTYTKMKKQKEDILKDFEYCVDILYTLLHTLMLYYIRPEKATESESTKA